MFGLQLSQQFWQVPILRSPDCRLFLQNYFLWCGHYLKWQKKFCIYNLFKNWWKDYDWLWVIVLEGWSCRYDPEKEYYFTTSICRYLFTFCYEHWNHQGQWELIVIDWFNPERYRQRLNLVDHWRMTSIHIIRSKSRDRESIYGNLGSNK